jgi:hypothetical protein
VEDAAAGLDQNNPNPSAVVGTQADPWHHRRRQPIAESWYPWPAAPRSAQRRGTPRSINGNVTQQVVIMVLEGDTASQIAAKVRAAVDAVFGLDATGTGGTVNIVGLGGTLTAYNITIT